LNQHFFNQPASLIKVLHSNHRLPKKPKQMYKLYTGIVHCINGNALSSLLTKKWIMRFNLICFILFIALLQVSYASRAQNVSISKKNATLQEIFREIKKQAGYDFLYSNLELKKAGRISINVQNQPLARVLEDCFKGQPFAFSIRNKTIIIVPSKEVTSETGMIKSIDIKGRILDEREQPIQGAVIKVKNGKQATLTNSKGEFILSGLNENSVLVISYLGYLTREVAALPDLGNIKLEISNSGLNEIRVIGYGTTTKRLNTGSINSISADEIGKQPVNSPLLALQGNVAGMYVTQSNGLPGGGVNISIRGQNSIGARNNPLYIIDGVPFNAQPIEQQSGGSYSLGANGNTSPFSTINPADIESISVLKDADATAIYGSRAANGVVLITTKKGKAGKTNVSLNFYTGIGQPASKLKTLSTEQYLELRRQAFANDNVTPSPSNAPDLVTWGTENKDFQKLLIGNTAHITEATASISGGSNNTTFFTSGTYRKEGSVFPGNKGYERGSALLNANHASNDKKFTASASISLSKDLNTLAPSDMTPAALTLPPNYPLYNPDGSLFWDNNFSNPIATVNNPYETKANNILANMALSYQLASGLLLKTTFGYNKLQSDQRFAYLQSNSGPNSFGTVAVQTSNFTEGLIVEPQVNYDKNFGKGKLQVLVGGTYQKSISKTPYSTGLTGFSSEKLAFNLASATTTLWLTNSASEYRYASVFGRINYQLAEKYILNISGRRDGSSRFGPNNKFGNFGAIGAAWIFSEESLIKQSMPWMSFGKLRASYGTVGNDQIADYGYLSTYRNNNYKYGGAVAISPARLANPDYSWENTRKMEVAMELGIAENRVLFTATAFGNRTNNMLVSNPLSAQTGFSSYQANLPALVQNTGLEFELNTRNIEKENLGWKSTFNLTIPRNKLTSFPEIENSTYANTYVVGQPLSILNLYRVKDIVNGIVQIEDANGDGVISTGIAANGLGDYVKVGQLAPKMYGGFTNNFRYKNWQLDVFLQFTVQKGYSNRYASTNPPGSFKNQDADILNVGLKPTASFGTPAYNSYLLYTYSDRVISNASYIRAKNISLSYRFPEKWTERINMKNVNLYLRGQNIFTISNYQGLDPETQQGFGNVVPPLKMFTVGIQCSL